MVVDVLCRAATLQTFPFTEGLLFKVQVKLHCVQRLSFGKLGGYVCTCTLLCVCVCVCECRPHTCMYMLTWPSLTGSSQNNRRGLRRLKRCTSSSSLSWQEDRNKRTGPGRGESHQQRPIVEKEITNADFEQYVEAALICSANSSILWGLYLFTSLFFKLYLFI